MQLQNFGSHSIIFFLYTKLYLLIDKNSFFYILILRNKLVVILFFKNAFAYYLIAILILIY